jgi:cytoskeleton protein RodZ
MLPSVGEQLKTAREARKATIDQASNATHIRPYIISAIEDGRYAEIPSNAQIKGFIRLYADWLNLPSKQLLDKFDGKIEEAIPPVEEKTEEVLPKEDLSPASNELENNEPVEKNELPETSPTVIDEILNPYSLNDSKNEPELEQLPELSSSILFRQIGAQLHSCREKLAISVDDIEKLTHIRSRYLIAMEAGDFTEIPSLVQARGLLSGYSTFLNLDTDNLLSIYADALQQRRIEMLPPEPEKKKSQKKRSTSATESSGIHRFFTVDLMIGSVVIIGLVGFGIWAAAQVISSGNLSIVSTAPPISDVLLKNPTVVSVANLTITAGPTGPVRNPDTIGQVPTTGSANDISPNGSPTPPVPSLGTSAMQVYIVPNQRVFLQVTVGKKVAFSGRTIPGNAYPFTSDERIEVVSGSAAALQIYYNQKDLGTLGLPGETLRLIFSKDGIATPTPAKSAAPSITALPTLTLMPTATPVPPTVTPLIP